MTDEIDEIFRVFDKMFEDMMKHAGMKKNTGVFPWGTTNEYVSDRNALRSQSMATREEIFYNDDNVTVVMRLGYGYSDENIMVELIEKNKRRILQVKSDDGKITRHYALSPTMTGKFEWYITNGIIEIVLQKTPEVVELGD